MLCNNVNRLCCWIEDQIGVLWSAIRCPGGEQPRRGESVRFPVHIMTGFLTYNSSNRSWLCSEFNIYFVCVCVTSSFQSSSSEHIDCHHRCPWRLDLLSDRGGTTDLSSFSILLSQLLVNYSLTELKSMSCTISIRYTIYIFILEECCLSSYNRNQRVNI